MNEDEQKSKDQIRVVIEDCISLLELSAQKTIDELDIFLKLKQHIDDIEEKYNFPEQMPVEIENIQNEVERKMQRILLKKTLDILNGNNN